MLVSWKLVLTVPLLVVACGSTASNDDIDNLVAERVQATITAAGFEPTSEGGRNTQHDEHKRADDSPNSIS